MDNLFFNEEHTMLVNMVRDFANTEIAPITREMDEKCEIPKEIIAQMAELGLMGIPVPGEYGGAGMDTVAYAAAVMELAKVDASVAITMAAHTSLGTLPIVIAGTEEQKQAYLPKLASGAVIGAFGLTEPEAGSDAGSTKTSAELDGDEYVVNGGKIFITNSGLAGLLTLTANIIENGENLGIGALIVDTDNPGLNIGILITDHNVRETLKIVDKVYIVNEGAVFFEGNPNDAINNEKIKNFYLGSNFSI